MSSPSIEKERNTRVPEAKQSPVHQDYPSPAKRKRKFPIGWTFLVLLAAGVACIWKVNHAPGGGNHTIHHHFGFGANGMSLPVAAATATNGSLDIYLDGLGTVTPLASVTVRSQISGQLAQVAFQEGQEVKKGDLLAVIDPRPYQVSLEQAVGQSLQAKAQLKQAQVDLARYQELAKQDSIAQQQVDDENALVSQYEGLVKTDQAAIDSANLNLTYCHIVAPVNGRVGLRLVDVGNYVTPGDASGIAVLAQIKPITAIFTLPEDDVQEVYSRLQAKTPIAVDAFDRTQTKKLASGTLATIDNEVDTSTGTVRLRAMFPNQDEALFPNQFVYIRMLLRTDTGSLIIPSSSVERGEEGPYVYLVKPDNTVTATPVKLGPEEGERVAIVSGLKAGDRVVSDGADKLKEGMSVIVESEIGSGAPKPAHRRQGGGHGAGQHGGQHHQQDTQKTE